jgi:sugar phosphate isomerase/epimerase
MPTSGVEPVIGLAGVDGVREGERVRRHHLVHLREAVHLAAVLLREHAHGATVLDDERRPVRALGQQSHRLTDGLVRVERDRGVEDQVSALHPGDHVLNHRGRDVLREDREAAPTRDGLRHPPARDGGHVGDDQRDRRASAVGCGQVDVVA